MRHQYWGLASTLSLLSSANVIISIIAFFIMIIIILIIIAKSRVWTKLPTRQYRFPHQAQSTAHAWTPTVRQSTSSLSSWLLSHHHHHHLCCSHWHSLIIIFVIVIIYAASCKYEKNPYKYTIEDANKYDFFVAGKYILSLSSFDASVLWTFKPNRRKHESTQVEGRQGVRHTTILPSSSWEERSSR